MIVIDELEPLVKKLLKDNMSVYTTLYSKDRKNTWIYFTDGINIGYTQYDKYTGLDFSTVHKPNKSTGTGFKVGSLPEQEYWKAFSKPYWAFNMESVRFENWESFAKNKNVAKIESIK